MKIERIKVNNFKSFDSLNIEFGNLNVIIGANASGKSNLISIFRFLKDIEFHGLENAISIQGGVEYLRNVTSGNKKNLYFEIFLSQIGGGTIIEDKKENEIGVEIKEIIYRFKISFRKTNQFEILQDEIITKLEYFKIKRKKGELDIKNKEYIGNGEFKVFRKKGRFKFELRKSNIDINLDELSPKIFSRGRDMIIKNNGLMIEGLHYFIPLIFTGLRELNFYNFDPKLAKKAISISGKTKFQEDGSNLAIMLRRIIKDKNKKRKLINLLKDVLPFIKDVSTDRFLDKSFIVTLKEMYSKNSYFPASFISDGTINIISLIVLLYFENDKVIMIEEPERNMHPKLISRVITMLKEKSKDKQIFITTNNPEFVKHSEIKDLFFISRNKNGYSDISKLSENNKIKKFLKNEIGVEELYIQDLLDM